MRGLGFSVSALFLVLALFLAGCAPAVPTGKPIVIGASLSLTGSYARTGQDMKNGIDLCLKDINARGGLLGRPVDLKFYDDESKPETGARLYERLITADQVDLLLGPYSSPVTSAASTVAEKYKYPMVATGASSAELWGRGYKYLFQIYTADGRYMDGAIELAAAQGLKTVAIINENTVFAKGAAAGAAAKAKEKGLQVVFQEEYRPGVKDLTATLQKVKALAPDVIVGGTYLPESVLITRQAKELDVNPKMFAFSVGPALPDFTKNLSADAEYIFGASQWEPTLALPGVKEFVEKYKAAYEGRDPSYQATGGYGGCQLLEQAVKKAGSLDREKLRETLASLETTTVYGAYKVDATGAQVAKPSYMTQVQKGQRVIVWPTDAATAKAIFPTPPWSARR
ncbi:MAG: amino acid ABC transporter substrate-binding protein [Chloroflexi bacterium]|nr:amino acid ABC transporter substrate-binding protein [Chloroflexota bacterium]